MKLVPRDSEAQVAERQRDLCRLHLRRVFFTSNWWKAQFRLNTFMPAWLWVLETRNKHATAVESDSDALHGGPGGQALTLFDLLLVEMKSDWT